MYPRYQHPIHEDQMEYNPVEQVSLKQTLLPHYH